DERWLIEECFRYYKNVTHFDDTKVHSDYSVYGSEFVNFISSVMTAFLRQESEHQWKRGRPRKEIDPNAQKKKRGRPWGNPS
ncbi:MAG TPA: hypothetical protein DIT55_03100, partial [Spirochaetaceae bacterium]|nr:hypothetical protein [Spirochaetaceae bacterium]